MANYLDHGLKPLFKQGGAIQNLVDSYGRFLTLHIYEILILQERHASEQVICLFVQTRSVPNHVSQLWDMFLNPSRLLCAHLCSVMLSCLIFQDIIYNVI